MRRRNDMGDGETKDGERRPRWKTVLNRAAIVVVIVVAVLAALVFLGIETGYIGGMTVYV
jgi:hypothetical protein